MKRVLLLASIALLMAGCASPNVNPLQARAKTGYVDFYAEPADDLMWEVTRFDERAQEFRSVFSEFDPPKGGFLRLAFAPGHYRLRLTFINRIVSDLAVVEVEVREGMITPVHVELIEAGTATVAVKKTNVGNTVYGRYGRSTKFRTVESATYRISAAAQPPEPYRPKQDMPYAPKPSQ